MMRADEAEIQVEKAKQLVRSNWEPRKPIGLSKRQAAGTVFFQPKHPDIWTSQAKFAVGDERQLRSAFLRALNRLDEHGRGFDVSLLTTIVGEWVGHRSSEQNTMSVKSEAERFHHLVRDTTGPMTILYVHGGIFIVGSPALSRPGLSHPLAKLSGGKVFALDYRLSPRNMFRAALYDLLLAYTFLLHPPAGALHGPIPAKNIVLAGDSAGMNLCFAFVQVLLQMRKEDLRNLNPTRANHLSESRFSPPDLPAGIAGLSGYVDHTDCMPSVETNTFDYFQQPKLENAPSHPHDAIWPSSPPRESVYCPDDLLTPPCCSPIGAKDWTGAPPMFIAVGEETVRDSCAVIAMRAASQGVGVRWREFEGVPHVWCLLRGYEQIPQTSHVLQALADFANDVSKSQGRSLGSDGAIMRRRTLQFEPVEIASLLLMDFSEARRRLREKAKFLMQKYASLHDKGGAKI